jgi:hypothetical protein
MCDRYAIAQQSTHTQRLQIIALEGHNAVNYIGFRSATAPIIEVRDENDRPVEGASVIFRLPTSGAGATFGGGQTTQTGLTDSRGQVGTTGYSINATPGSFVIEVSATYQNLTGRLLVPQTNSADIVPAETPKKSSKKKWIIVSVAAAAGAVAGYVVATGGTTPISVGSGPIVVGGPR